MNRIRKALFFNVVAICTCACLFVGTIADAAPCLRPHSLFDKVNDSQNRGRIYKSLFKIQTLIHKSLTTTKAPYISYRKKEVFLSTWSYVRNLILSIIFLSFTAYRLHYDLLLKKEIGRIGAIMPELTYAEILEKCTTPYHGAPLPFGLYKLINSSSLLLHVNHWWLNDFLYFPSLATFGYAMVTFSYLTGTSSVNRIKFVRGGINNIKSRTQYLRYLYFLTAMWLIVTINYIAAPVVKIDDIIILSLSIFSVFLTLPFLVFPVNNELESKLSLDEKHNSATVDSDAKIVSMGALPIKNKLDLSSKNPFFTKPKLAGALEKTLRAFTSLKLKLSQI